MQHETSSLLLSLSSIFQARLLVRRLPLSPSHPSDQPTPSLSASNLPNPPRRPCYATVTIPPLAAPQHARATSAKLARLSARPTRARSVIGTGDSERMDRACACAGPDTGATGRGVCGREALEVEEVVEVEDGRRGGGGMARGGWRVGMEVEWGGAARGSVEVERRREEEGWRSVGDEVVRGGGGRGEPGSVSSTRSWRDVSRTMKSRCVGEMAVCLLVRWWKL